MTDKLYVPQGYAEVLRGGNIICHDFQKNMFRQMFEAFPEEMNVAVHAAMKKVEGTANLCCITFFAASKDDGSLPPKEIHCAHYLLPSNAKVEVCENTVATQLSHSQPYYENIFVIITA